MPGPHSYPHTLNPHTLVCTCTICLVCECPFDPCVSSARTSFGLRLVHQQGSLEESYHMVHESRIFLFPFFISMTSVQAGGRHGSPCGYFRDYSRPSALNIVSCFCSITEADERQTDTYRVGGWVIRARCEQDPFDAITLVCVMGVHKRSFMMRTWYKV